MKIKMMNVYNTQSIKKDVPTLKNIAKKHLTNIKKQILLIDKNVKFTLESINYVDWKEYGRGEDVRFYLNIEKTGRKITARKIYQICNNACLRACYY
jgi:ABC-type microcin C transport system permease subunit YejE